jgi:hypothetical protein
MKAIAIITNTKTGKTVGVDEYQSKAEARNHFESLGWVKSGLTSGEFYHGDIECVIGYTKGTVQIVSKKDWEQLYQYMY